MAWKTLYITGKPGFDQEVLDNLEKSSIHFLTGSVNPNGCLIWVTDNLNLREFKKAIGSKVIFNYRLHFFFSVDTLIASTETGKKRHHFTAEQEQMFRDLNDLL